MQVQSLGREDSLEEGMVTHSNILAWTVPWAEEPDGLQFIVVQRVGHNGKDLAYMPRERELLLLRNWLMQLWRLGRLKIYRLDH